MSTTLEETPAGARTDPAGRLRSTMAASRLAFTWLGVRKSLTSAQKQRAAESFGAEGGYLSAGKKLLDTRHPQFKAVTAVKNRAAGYWRSLTLPFPEPGVRLIRQDRIEAFDRRMSEFREELAEAVAALDRHYGELKAAARRRLGDLYDPADYPDSLIGLFAIQWEFPSVEPPDYLRRLNPDLYEQEARRVAARFDEAVRLAEEAFLGELSQLVSHLCERLSGTDDGKPKVFRDSAVGNLQDFFGRFRDLNVRSSEELDQLVERARSLVGGVEPQQLRDDRGLRQRIAGELSAVQSVVDGLLVDRPRRRILRPDRSSED